MFEAQGLNVARQPDNGSNPRPDNRSGWLDGETPDIVEDYLDTAAQAEDSARPALKITTWDPAAQLRYQKKDKVPPRPDGAPNRWPGQRADASERLSGMPFGH